MYERTIIAFIVFFVDFEPVVSQKFLSTKVSWNLYWCTIKFQLYLV